MLPDMQFQEGEGIVPKEPFDNPSFNMASAIHDLRSLADNLERNLYRLTKQISKTDTCSICGDVLEEDFWHWVGDKRACNLCDDQCEEETLCGHPENHNNADFRPEVCNECSIIKLNL